jgi:hypothetical protein
LAISLAHCVCGGNITPKLLSTMKTLKFFGALCLSILLTNSALPPGDDYDAVSTVLRIEKVDNGRIVLASGMSYAVLILPPGGANMRPETLRDVRRLVGDGATIVGPKPNPTGRYTFATYRHWTEDSPLLESGLLGPVRLIFGKQMGLPPMGIPMTGSAQ